MSETFTKLFSSITDSSVWAEDHPTVRVWITLLAMADQHGYVGAAIPGLAGRARVTVAEAESAIGKFLAPDPYSRSKEHDGRRIEVSDRGWTLLNHARFRDMRDEEVRKTYERERKRRQRASAKVKDAVPDSPDLSRDVPRSPALSAQAEAEAEAESKIKSDKPTKYDAEVGEVWDEQSRIRRGFAGLRSLKRTADRSKRIAARLKAGATVEDCFHVLAVYEARAKANPDQVQWLNGTTPWRPENFDRALGQAVPKAKGKRQPSPGESREL